MSEAYAAPLSATPTGALPDIVIDLFAWTHFGAPTDEEWADPAATLQGRLRFGLVVLDGVVWQIVDMAIMPDLTNPANPSDSSPRQAGAEQEATDGGSGEEPRSSPPPKGGDR